MTPQEALEMQINIYRQMTGEQRLRIGLQLSDLSCTMALAGIKHQFPDATEEQLQRELLRRVEIAWK